MCGGEIVDEVAQLPAAGAVLQDHHSILCTGILHTFRLVLAPGAITSPSPSRPVLTTCRFSKRSELKPAAGPSFRPASEPVAGSPGKSSGCRLPVL